MTWRCPCGREGTSDGGVTRVEHQRTCNVIRATLCEEVHASIRKMGPDEFRLACSRARVVPDPDDDEALRLVGKCPRCGRELSVPYYERSKPR